MFLFTINAVLSELMENNVVVVKKMVKNSVEHILKVFPTVKSLINLLKNHIKLSPFGYKKFTVFPTILIKIIMFIIIMTSLTIKLILKLLLNILLMIKKNILFLLYLNNYSSFLFGQCSFTVSFK